LKHQKKKGERGKYFWSGLLRFSTHTFPNFPPPPPTIFVLAITRSSSSVALLWSPLEKFDWQTRFFFVAVGFCHFWQLAKS